MADLKALRLDPQTVYILLIFVGLFVLGLVIGNYTGSNRVQSDIIEAGGQTQSLSGTVKSVDDEGFTLETKQGNWEVHQSKQGAAGAPGGIGGPGAAGGQEQDLKDGDEVQVTGLALDENTLVAQSVTKVIPPSPSPKAKAAPASRP